MSISTTALRIALTITTAAALAPVGYLAHQGVEAAAWRVTTDDLVARSLAIAEDGGLPTPTATNVRGVIEETMAALDPEGAITVDYNCDYLDEEGRESVIGAVLQEEPTSICLAVDRMADGSPEHVQQTVAHEWAHLLQAWAWTDWRGRVKVDQQDAAYALEIGTATAEAGDLADGGTEIQADCIAYLMGATAPGYYAPEGCSPTAEASAWRVLHGKR